MMLGGMGEGGWIYQAVCGCKKHTPTKTRRVPLDKMCRQIHKSGDGAWCGWLLIGELRFKTTISTISGYTYKEERYVRNPGEGANRLINAVCTILNAKCVCVLCLVWV